MRFSSSSHDVTTGSEGSYSTNHPGQILVPHPHHLVMTGEPAPHWHDCARLVGDVSSWRARVRHCGQIQSRALAQINNMRPPLLGMSDSTIIHRGNAIDSDRQMNCACTTGLVHVLTREAHLLCCHRTIAINFAPLSLFFDWNTGGCECRKAPPV